MNSENSATLEWTVKKVKTSVPIDSVEFLAVEKPLEIALVYSTANGRIKKSITVTMRTPGADEDLAMGFLFGEGIISSSSQVDHVQHKRLDENEVIVTLLENQKPVLINLSRNFFSSSSCGICGKTAITPILPNELKVSLVPKLSILARTLYLLPSKLIAIQEHFSSTGGLHAAAIADLEGNIILLREDIGRHNAVDKVIGAALNKPELHLHNSILVLSGRTGYELVQKATRAGIPVIAGIGAPSSMAVEMAAEYGITLIGFLKADRFNIYCGADRIIMD